MNAIVKTGAVLNPTTAAPVGFGPGGPLPAPTPWILYANWIGYTGGVVVGNPAGGNKGPGTLNATSIYMNGVIFDVSNLLPLTGGAITGNLSVSGTLTVPTIDGATLDMGTF